MYAPVYTCVPDRPPCIKDTLNTESCPTAVHISAGLDVLFHSMESLTAIPYVCVCAGSNDFDERADTRNALLGRLILSFGLLTKEAIPLPTYSHYGHCGRASNTCPVLPKTPAMKRQGDKCCKQGYTMSVISSTMRHTGLHHPSRA
jgi:hypothetical protein